VRKNKRKFIVKKIMFAGAAIAVLSMFAMGGAKAAVIDVGIDLSSVSQVSKSTVTQGAASVAVAIGSVRDSGVTSTAANINNDLTEINDLSLDGGHGFVDGGLLANSVSQVTADAVKQSALSIAGSGGLNGSSLSSIAANLNNEANVTIDAMVTK
jgi:DNA-binding transcriptional regulator YdaS (Cro superfamily)